MFGDRVECEKLVLMGFRDAHQWLGRAAHPTVSLLVHDPTLATKVRVSGDAARREAQLQALHQHARTILKALGAALASAPHAVFALIKAWAREQTPILNNRTRHWSRAFVTLCVSSGIFSSSFI